MNDDRDKNDVVEEHSLSELVRKVEDENGAATTTTAEQQHPS